MIQIQRQELLAVATALVNVNVRERQTELSDFTVHDLTAPPAVEKEMF